MTWSRSWTPSFTRAWLTCQYETRGGASSQMWESIRLHRAIYEAAGTAAGTRRAMDSHMALVRETYHVREKTD